MSLETEIKRELVDGSVLCQACLSFGRTLHPLGKYVDVYRKVLPDLFKNDPVLQEGLICWECKAILQKILEFQGKVQQATELLTLRENYLHGTLSNLISITINDTHPNTIYINTYTLEERAAEHRNECKTEMTDDNLSPNNDMQMDLFSEDEEKATGHKSKSKADMTDHDLSQNNDKSYNVVSDDVVKLESNNKEIVRKRKNNYRWAKKRALENKKPKYKILSHEDVKSDELFIKCVLGQDELLRHMEKERNSERFKLKKHKCDPCVLAFKSENTLRKHQIKHAKDSGMYDCDVCTIKLHNKRSLSVHVTKHYVRLKCKVCDYTCNNAKQKFNHVDAKHRRLYECLKCGLKFSCRRDFYKHFKAAHEMFICDYCGISFKMRYCIKNHIRKQHSRLQCKICSKSFGRYNALWLHNKVRHTTPERVAYCVECDKVYPDKYRYQWHLANSAKHKPKKRIRVPCPSCEKVFSKNIYMKDHYNKVHLKLFKYRCEDCDKNFIRNAELVLHKRRIHEGILPPKNKICNVCGRGFSTNRILSNHVRTHTGERPHACSHCPAKFIQRCSLLSHQRAFHSSTAH